MIQKSEIKAAHNLLVLWDCSDLVISDLLDLSLEDKKKFFSHKYESIQFTEDQVELFRLIHKIHRLLKKKFIIGPEIYGMMQKKHEFFDNLTPLSWLIKNKAQPQLFLNKLDNCPR